MTVFGTAVIRRIGCAAGATIVLAAGSTGPAAAVDQPPLQRVSLGQLGAQADAESFGPSVSADGRYVAFSSSAGNLVPGDSNGKEDVFVRDLRTGQTVRASVGTDGGQSSGYDSRSASISADGRYVAFHTRAGNLVPGDTNDSTDVFVRDLVAGRTLLVSVRDDGSQPAGGRGLAAGQPAISGDGSRVVFIATYPDLVPGDSNGRADVFVRDLRTGRTERASLATGGAQSDALSTAPVISRDGRSVAFVSTATNLVRGDTNALADVFVRDLRTGQTARASVGGPAPDTRGGQQQADGASLAPTLSADGGRVSFTSAATNLVRGDTNGVDDVFVRDLRAARTVRASVGDSGAQGDGRAVRSGLSDDGHSLAFTSLATNLVEGDTNRVGDVFVRDLATDRTERATPDTADGFYYLASPVLAAGSVVYESAATNLVPGDSNGATDIFASRLRR